ncbi:MAG TPA: dethiobiotin synthase [Candidatus Acidoferrales bacterium]|nr:dethiobiotin synthase [Candidatus Acidoferrales bacterium]
MKQSLFVTGTDTNVGKTLLSALLVAVFDAIYWKPIQTGAREGTDRVTVIKLAEIRESQTIPETYCFDPPVSPHLAAQAAGARISLAAIRPPQDSAKPIIAEGAGGILVPINDSELMLDLARHLGFPIVIAARSALGTINHTLLTVRALRCAKMPIKGFVMIGDRNKDNECSVERYGGVPLIGWIPWLDSINRRTLLTVFRTNFLHSYFDDVR